jgi:peptidoglycan/LPS O-acetylase OafA/YrhL
MVAALVAAKFFAPPAGVSTKYPAIDQLRGLLALMVLWSHAVRMPGLYAPSAGATAAWETVFPEHHPLMAIGSLAVGLFFCITGFLFWERPVPPDSSKFLEGRIRRLAVPFLATAALCSMLTVLILLLESGPLAVLHHARNIASFFTFGFTAEAHPSTTVLMGMAWSLSYEWAFYLALPLLWVLRRWSRLLPHAVFVAALFFVFPGRNGTLGLFLWAGMCVAEITPFLRKIVPSRNITLYSWLCAGLFLLLVGTGVFDFNRYQAPVLAVLFLSVTLVHDGQGPLCKSVLLARLGRMTYSLYLIHGTVLYLLFVAVSRVAPVKSELWLDIWTGLATIAAIGVARMWFERFENRSAVVRLP